MAHQKAGDFNQHAQGILEELEKAEPSAVPALATSFVKGVVENGLDNRPELCKDFAGTLAKVIPDSATRTSLVSSLLNLCQEGSDSLTLQLYRIIGENHERAPLPSPS